MAAGDRALSFIINMKANDMASNVIRGLASGSGALGAIVGVAAVAAGALVGLGVAAVKSAGDFQGAVLSLVAHAGLAKDQVNNVSQAVLAMASEVGRSPTQLAEALYPILSAFSGITNQSAKTKLALETLKLSFEAVAGTTVDGTAVANAAVGTFNALGLSTNNAATNTQRMTTLMDQMDLTVKLGNMTWDQYKNVISKLAVSIKGTGVSFNEASAALAMMTAEGYTAQRAQTYLSNTFTTIAIKTDVLAKHAAKLGIAFDQAKYGPMSLADKIAYLNHVTGGNQQKLLALMGNNATALKTFNALSTGVDIYKTNLDGLNHSQGALKASFDTASQGFNFQISRMKAAGEALLISIGTPLLGVLSKLVAGIVPLINKFTDWENKTHGVEKGISQFSGFLDYFKGLINQVVDQVKPMIEKFIEWNNHSQFLQKAVGFLAVYVKALGAELAFVIPIIVGIIIEIVKFADSIYRSIKPALDNFARFWKAHWVQIHAVLLGVWEAIQGVVLWAWSIIKGIILIGLDILSGNWSKLWADMLDMLGGMWKGVLMIVGGGMQAILNSMVMWADPIFSSFVKPFYDAYNAVAKLLGQPIAVAPTLSHLVGTIDILGSMSGANGRITDILAQQRAAAAARHDFYANKNSSLSTSNPFATPNIPTTNPMSTNYPTSAGGSGGGTGSGHSGHHRGHHVSATAFTATDIASVVANAKKIHILINATLLDSLSNSQKLKYLFDKAHGHMSVFNELLKGTHKGLKDFADYMLSLHKAYKGVTHHTYSGVSHHHHLGAAIHHYKSASVPGFASGVQNFAGGLAMVGERGPELLQLPGGSSVYPLRGSSSAFAATSPSTQGGYSHATIQVYLDKRMIGEIAGQHIAKEMRIQAGVKQ